MANKKQTPLYRFYFTANAFEKKAYRGAAILNFGFGESHFYNWIKTDNPTIEALALWQYVFDTEIMEKWVVNNYKFQAKKIKKYREPDLFNNEAYS